MTKKRFTSFDLFMGCLTTGFILRAWFEFLGTPLRRTIDFKVTL